MELSSWTLIFIVCVGLYYYFKNRLNYFEDRGIPYLPGWPIFGNMAEPLLRRKHFIEMVKDIYNVNPNAKYVGGFDFMTPVVILRDPDLIKSVTIKSFDHFHDHRTFIDDTIDPLFGSNLANMTGERWREARALLTPAFTSSKMKGMYELMVECCKNFLNYLDDQPADTLRMVNTKDLFTKLTNDIIATCAFGISVDSLKNPKNDFYVLGKEATNFDGILVFKAFFVSKFPKFFKFIKMSLLSKRVTDFFFNIVQETVTMRDEKGISRPDMIQLMMDARGKDSDNLKIDIVTMTAQAFIFFLGGFDTTSNQLCIIAHELAINPDVQKKLQDEIDDVMKESDGKPSYEQVVNMPYLDAVFNESMRKDTQAALLDRVCTSSFELPPALPGGKPFTVAKGMGIWIPGAAIHTDPNYYENPEKFDPDRYYEKKVTINDVNNLGFGIGPRSCIGNRFAVLETKVLLLFLLSRYNLRPNEKTCNPFVYSKKSFNLMPEGGFVLSIEPRK